ncbi:MAG TPA: HAD-IC family P-type ATPase, partial [archaeon]|nr:HAD-IC family P-type ATPase [archaeon]
MEKWHTLRVEDVFSKLETSEIGLNRIDAKLRLEEYGPNTLTERRRIEPIKIFLRQFKSFLIIILIVAAAISAFFRSITESYIIISIVLINAVLGFAQEYKAEKAMEALKKMASPTSKVIRSGKQIEIPSRKLVPGDVIHLEEGDKVPADARLFKISSLKVDESSLTGESMPITKETRILRDAPLAERKNMVFLGTTVSYGNAYAVVANTGMQTEMGKIAKMIQVEEVEVTPLQKRLDQFGIWMGILVIILSCITFMLGVARKGDLLTMFMTSVVLAVSAVPEGLPAIVTATLALGMRKMTKFNAFVRKLSAVETLGCTTVICADKTGTMTTNEMTVRKIYCDDKTISISKIGFEPMGEFTSDEIANPKEDEHVRLLLKIGLLCNDARLEYVDDRWQVSGDPTEGALVVAAAKANMWMEKIKNDYSTIAELPFSSERKMMTTVHQSKNGIFAYSKGAPETILEFCKHTYKDKKVKALREEEKEKILSATHKMASEGLRVIAFAFKEMEKAEFTPEKVEENLIFAGLAGIIDPPREEVKESIRICKEAGINVVMITGDHKQTATSIARELGIIQDEYETVLTGNELNELTEEKLEKIVENVKVYARVSPEHKVKILNALKKNGHVVAMTGDGVNDAPALKNAHIGVAMGVKGTDVAKEASDIVLLDDNFSTIVKTVEEGRGIYDNIKKTVRFLLSINFDEMFVVVLAMLMYLPLPFLPIHILWINLVSDSLPALSLSIDTKEKEIMKRKPRNPKEHILS